MYKPKYKRLKKKKKGIKKEPFHSSCAQEVTQGARSEGASLTNQEAAQMW